MSWMPIETARKIRDEIKTVAPWADTRLEVHPADSTRDQNARARVTLVMRKAKTGNTVVREAEESTVAAEFIAEAQRELAGRGRETARRIRAERAPS